MPGHWTLGIRLAESADKDNYLLTNETMRTAGIIEEGWKQKARQGRRVGLGGKICSIPCRASCFVSVYMEEMVEFNRFF